MSPPSITTDAVTRCLAGDREGALALLQPLVDQGPKMTVAVLSMLAEIASMPARAHQPASSFLGLVVSDVDTGREASTTDLPAPIRFAGQFMTAHANGDRATAYAMFDAFAARCVREESAGVAGAVAALLDMAVVSALELAKHGRRPT